MKHNFGAGPCILPQSVFQEAAKGVLDFNGLSILEVSHRHKDFVAVMEEACDLVKKALNVPEGYTVLFLQGGATLGFTIAAINMMRSGKAAYINTGTWASGAIKEAKLIGCDVQVIASSEDKKFSYIPTNFEIPNDLDYLHYTSNNTIYGTQFHETPKTNLPLVCDMSSDIFSKEIHRPCCSLSKRSTPNCRAVRRTCSTRVHPVCCSKMLLLPASTVAASNLSMFICVGREH